MSSPHLAPIGKWVKVDPPLDESLCQVLPPGLEGVGAYHQGPRLVARVKELQRLLRPEHFQEQGDELWEVAKVVGEVRLELGGVVGTGTTLLPVELEVGEDGDYGLDAIAELGGGDNAVLVEGELLCCGEVELGVLVRPLSLELRESRARGVGWEGLGWWKGEEAFH